MAYYITETCTGCGSCSHLCPTGAISGEKKELHTIDADGCIECGACGRICPAGSVEDPFGVAAIRVKKSEWNIPVFDTKACMACVICTDSCPTGSIQVGEPQGKDPNGYPCLPDPSTCLGCGLCMGDCPADAITMGPR